MNKQIRNLILLTLLALAWSCNDNDDEPIAVASISLDAATKTLSPGEEFDLTATITPSNAANKDVDWSTSDAGVATVNADGHVIAIARGMATITVKTDDGGKTATCAVTVTKRVDGVTLNASELKLYIEEDATLIATVTPNDADSKEVAWSSDNEAVATVNEDGRVTAIAAGTATITATTVEGEKTAICAVAVAARYTFSGASKDVVTAVYGDYSGGYQFWLYPTAVEDGIFEGANEFVRIDIPREMMGATFSLTEENPYDWDWRVAYRHNATHETYEGRGYVDGMGDVDGGTLYARKTGEDTFEVTFDVLFTDGKRLKGTYAGTLVMNNDYYGKRAAPGRRRGL
jgi:hypothetical protein